MSQRQSAQIQTHVMDRFHIIKKVGSGAYGHVWKIEEKTTHKIYALKKIFDAFQHSTDAQRTFRQIEILQQINHPNIVKLYQTIPAQNNKDVYLIFEFMESDLHNAIGDDIMKDAHFKFIIYQIAKALKYLHTGSIIHRDLKPSNILVNSDCKIKLCDFGLVRSINVDNENNPVLTEGVATRWYRAPQVLLGSKSYSTPADIWSFGCIIFEMIQRKPLFAGNSTLDQLQKILSFTGMPSQTDIQSLQSQVGKSMIRQVKLLNYSQSSSILRSIPQQFINLLQKMLVFNPKKRISVNQILQHPLVKAFRKQQQQISSLKPFVMSIDDNRRLTVQQYRKIIYKINQQQKIIHNKNFIKFGTNQDKQILTKMKSFDILPKKTLPMNGFQSPKNPQNKMKNSWKQLVYQNQDKLFSSGKIIQKQQSKKLINIKNSQKDLPKNIQVPQNKFKYNQVISPKNVLEKKQSISSFMWASPNKKSKENKQKIQSTGIIGINNYQGRVNSPIRNFK